MSCIINTIQAFICTGLKALKGPGISCLEHAAWFLMQFVEGLPEEDLRERFICSAEQKSKSPRLLQRTRQTSGTRLADSSRSARSGGQFSRQKLPRQALDRRHQFRHRFFDGGRQSLALLKILSTQSHGNGLWGSSIKLLRTGKDRGGRELMEESHRSKRHFDGLTADQAGLAVLRGSDENDGRGAVENFGRLRNELVQPENFNLGGRQIRRQPVRDMPADTFVAVERIAVSENKNSRHCL